MTIKLKKDIPASGIEATEYDTITIMRLNKEITRLRQRVAELEAAYAERGERMKEMRDCFTVEDWKRGRWCCEKYWFKDGEPL